MSQTPTQPSREIDNNLILQFRTITSMIHALQQLPTHDKKPMELRTREERQELRVLGALATVLVRRYEVTAVATGGSSGDVSLVACASDSRTSPSFDDESSLTDTFITTNNPRRGPSITDRITVVQVWETEMDVMQPLDYILKKWDIGLRFGDHAHAVFSLLRNIATLHSAETPQKTALPQEHSGCEVAEHNLLRYVIGASFQKMYDRLKPSNQYSANFLNTLLHLDDAWERYDPKPPSTPNGTPKYSAMDEDFLDFVVLLPDQIQGLSIPHLTRLASEFVIKRKPIQHLYTRDTYREIHHLLCRLLTAYQERLHKLNEFTKPQGKEALAQCVIDVALVGVGLHTMAYGSVLQKHFEEMSDHLITVMHSKPWAKKPDDPEVREHSTILPEGALPSDEPQDDPELLQDSELIAVQPQTKITDTGVLGVSESFYKWSRLMVSYFEALKTVTNFVKDKKSKFISLTVVNIPHQGQKMMTWSDLADGPYDTVEEKHPTFRFDTPSLRFGDPPGKPEVDLATDDAAWAAQLKTITNADDFRRAVKYITSTHTSMVKFFDKTAALSVGDNFTGTVHCEASLASLVHARNTQYDTPDPSSLWFASNINPYIGISKWCCPVCEDLLDVLHRTQSGKRFQVSGYHRTIYACTLPPWLPHDALVEMRKRYWHRLLGTLVEVVQTTSLLRPTSSGSHAQSTISSQSKKRVVGWKTVFKLFKPRRPK